MKPYRFALFAFLAVALVGVGGCSNNDSAKTEADVFLSINIPTGVADVNMAHSGDVVEPAMTITSHGKSPTAVLSQQDDVVLSEWVVTCTRTDGGSVASPVWHDFNQTTYVPAGGTASLVNYRIFPGDYFLQPPLNQLLCSGCLDKETNNPNIRQRLHIVIYGKTIAGKKVSLEFDVNLNFFYTP